MNTKSAPSTELLLSTGSVPGRRRAIALTGALLVAILIATVLSVASPKAEAQAGPRVALISRQASPLPGDDRAYFDRLTETGWNVTVVDDDEIRDRGKNAVKGFDLVLVSSTVFADRIRWRLRTAPEPVIVAEHQLFDNFYFTTSRSSVGLTTSSRKINVISPNSPLAAGFSGETFVSTKAKPQNYGRVGGDVHIAAVAKDDNNQAVLFSYDEGDALATGDAATARRVGIHMSQILPKLTNPDGWRFFDAAVAWASGRAAPSNDAPVFPPIAPTSGAHLGANVDRGEFATAYDAFADLEDQLGRDLTIAHRYHEFSSGLTSSFFWDRRFLDDGLTLMVSWRATDNPNSNRGEPDPNRAAKIVRGQFDAEINAMARGLRDLEAPVLLRFNAEMDQEPGDPQHIGFQDDFIAAWRYVHETFQEVGATNVEWLWSPRASSFNKNEGQSYYPGDAYVDWIGGSAVPIATYRDVESIYGAWNDWASAKDKPQMLYLGLPENPNDPQWKSGFLDDVNARISGPWDNVRALMYYHSGSPLGLDYTVDTSPQSLRSFRDIACNAHFETTDRC